MKDALDKIKSVLATKDFGTHLNHYLFEPGWILASDGRMIAAAPADHDLACLVPGPELEAVVGGFKTLTSLTHTDEKLTIKSGRLRGAITTLPVEQVSFFRPVGEWKAPPEGLIEALRLVRPFIAETAVQPWALCACIRTGGVVATNNMSIVLAECPGLDIEGEVLLPSWAVDFVLKHAEPLDAVMWDSNYAAFRWESGLWFRTQLVEGQFPPQIGKILAGPERATTPIDSEWLREYMAVAELSESSIVISSTEIVGGHGKAEVRSETTTELLASINFNPKFLTPVLVKAAFWAPEIYPAPVPFRGEGFSGVVVGRKS